MKTNFKWLLFAGILLFYTALYTATSVPKPCDAVCLKFRTIDSLMRKNTAADFTSNCHKATYCIQMNDSTMHNRSGLADAACMYMKNEELHNYTVILLDNQGDTLLTQTCH